MHRDVPYLTSFRTSFLLFVLGYIMWSTWNNDIRPVFGMATGGVVMIILVEIAVALLNRKERERLAQPGHEGRL